MSIDYKDGQQNKSTQFCVNIETTDENKSEKILRKAVFLGVCYSANIGGTGALTGTSTNLILNEVLSE